LVSLIHYALVLRNALPKERGQPIVHSSQANQFDSTASLFALSVSQFQFKLKSHLCQQSLLYIRHIDPRHQAILESGLCALNIQTYCTPSTDEARAQTG